jgi:hypothetical protein
MATITAMFIYQNLLLRRFTMNSNLSFFDRMMSAITFAEAGELDWNQELVDNDMSNRERQSWTPALSADEMMSTPVAH